FVALGISWLGFVLGSILQLGVEGQATVLQSSDLYPVQRPGAATMGLQVYRAEGCAACHTEQIRQEGVACDVVLTAMGNNPAAVKKAVAGLGAQISDATNALPKTVLSRVSKAGADAATASISSAGGTAEIHIVATGPDIARGWGVRGSVARDYLWDDPVQLGNLRAGPDLANVGARLGNVTWQLLHLYAPQSVVKGSAMPPFRFLFRVEKIGGAPSPDALQLPKPFAPAPGYEVVPTRDARNLAAYLVSLHADVPLFEAPFTPEVSTK
ncbi:MAG: cbb3-type cytochrome c oxidase subunit II, partial [Verrucomicrobia bacterium]|nr:cbb3-type cytochrome c oxidase subunit II [Verrucomicrobiota bacterium]